MVAARRGEQAPADDAAATSRQRRLAAAGGSGKELEAPSAVAAAPSEVARGVTRKELVDRISSLKVTLAASDSKLEALESTFSIWCDRLLAIQRANSTKLRLAATATSMGKRSNRRLRTPVTMGVAQDLDLDCIAEEDAADEVAADEVAADEVGDLVAMISKELAALRTATEKLDTGRSYRVPGGGVGATRP